MACISLSADLAESALFLVVVISPREADHQLFAPFGVLLVVHLEHYSNLSYHHSIPKDLKNLITLN